MKRFLPILIVVILLVSIIGIVSASAGASISGSSTVIAGRSYTYTGKATYSAGDLIGKIEGLGKNNNFGAMAGGMVNKTLSGSAAITVTIPASAKPGDTFKIVLSGKYSDMNPDGSGDLTEESYSKTLTITVVERQTPDPNATSKPLEGWEIVEVSVDEAEKGAVVEAMMEDDYEIPEDLLKKIVDNENKLVVDFGTYKCTIDPAVLTDFEDINKLNLKLDFEKNAGLSDIAGGLDTYQLHFGHSGELPGMLTYTFEATENKPGDTVFLYYYYGEANVIEGKMKAVVDEDGMVTFDIYHCSSYFVTSEIIEGAVSNFDGESAAQIEEYIAVIGEKQTELGDALATIESLTADKTALETDLAAAEQEKKQLDEQAASTVPANKNDDQFSLVVLIAAAVAAALLSILLTMLITRSGLFRKSEDEKEVNKRRKQTP